jgi:hypothetical protein
LGNGEAATRSGPKPHLSREGRAEPYSLPSFRFVERLTDPRVADACDRGDFSWLCRWRRFCLLVP